MRSKANIAGLGTVLGLTILVLASCGQPVPFTSTPIGEVIGLGHVVAGPPPPASLAVHAADTGADLEAGSWTNSPTLELSAATAAKPGDRIVVEAEFLPEQQPFAGIPNVIGEPGETTLTSPQMEAGQQYHWAARVRNVIGASSPWVRFEGSVGFQPDPPPVPAVHPLPHGGWLGSRTIDLAWDAQSDPAGTAGFAYALDQSPAGALPVRIDTTAETLKLTAPQDGDWYLHLRSIDGAGNASGVATVPLHIDSTPLEVEAPKLDVDGSWNPILGPLAVHLKANKAAQLEFAILPDSGDTPVRVMRESGTSEATVQWDGKDGKGQPVPPGKYRLRLDASDKTGRTAQALAEEPLPVTNKRIVVYLGQERMVAYEGDKPFIDTLVTTGGPELPTPVGTFRIISKFSPFTFKSPWPKGSPYWYADSPTSFAMLFESSGYFIHDAPWRSWFGPGSNAYDGRPGGNGTGTHGCVNVPYGVQAKLFGWTDVGTPVTVQE